MTVTMAMAPTYANGDERMANVIDRAPPSMPGEMCTSETGKRANPQNFPKT